MVRALECSDLPISPEPGWLDDFVADFQGRLVGLLSFKFRELPVTLALSLLRSAATAVSVSDCDAETRQTRISISISIESIFLCSVGAIVDAS